MAMHHDALDFVSRPEERVADPEKIVLALLVERDAGSQSGVNKGVRTHHVMECRIGQEPPVLFGHALQ